MNEEGSSVDRLQTFDDYLKHFDRSFDSWDWWEIASEGRRLAADALKQQGIDEHSPLGVFFHAVAAESARGAYASVAAMLGVDAKALREVADLWIENRHEPFPPITYDELVAEIADRTKRSF